MRLIIQLKQRSNLRLSLGISLCLEFLSLGFLSLSMPESARALPGQTVEEVASWIQSHPTLQPASGETLRVRKTDTPAHRFTFEALMAAPGGGDSDNRNLIRMEQLSFFDRTTGVSPSRLQTALQVIYGADVYQDYQQATVVYQYPDPVSQPALNATPDLDTSLRALLQGEVRQGDRYAYWLETVPTTNGVAYNGQISVLLIEDVEGLVSALQRR